MIGELSGTSSPIPSRHPSPKVPKTEENLAVQSARGRRPGATAHARHTPIIGFATLRSKCCHSTSTFNNTVTNTAFTVIPLGCRVATCNIRPLLPHIVKNPKVTSLYSRSFLAHSRLYTINGSLLTASRDRVKDHIQ